MSHIRSQAGGNRAGILETAEFRLTRKGRRGEGHHGDRADDDESRRLERACDKEQLAVMGTAEAIAGRRRKAGSGKDSPYQARTGRSSVRRSRCQSRSGWRRCISSSRAIGRNPGWLSSSGTMSLFYTPSRGSGICRRGFGPARFWEGRRGSRSILRAVRSLIPALAAATSCVCWRRNSM
jgi:hypothetical protein